MKAEGEVTTGRAETPDASSQKHACNSQQSAHNSQLAKISALNNNSSNNNKDDDKGKHFPHFLYNSFI
jgi:hypothetical protein